MPVPALMIQGTGSHVGKSVFVAGLCRAFARRGVRVVPFKPQNMSNNAAVTADGGEIGRAQALQARAAGLLPSVHMNPILLKPEGETGAQVIVQGRRAGTMRAIDFGKQKAALLPRVLESFAEVSSGADLVLVEGAGSTAEVNLRAGDIANMGFAAAAGVPVVLLGDIDRGGVIASLVGTATVLDEADRRLVKGFLVNKFRGDAGLFESGLRVIEERTGWPSLGVIPWFEAAHLLPSEDVLGLAGSSKSRSRLTVAVLALPRIANFDDLDPLRLEPGVSVIVVRSGEPLPPDADVVVIPGSKATMADLAFVKAEGWDIDLRAHRRRGGIILGLCGGYQMLGRSVSDPEGVEGRSGAIEGLGLLDVETVLAGDKTTTLVEGRDIATGEEVAGYEIHLGRTAGSDCARPVLDLGGRPDGARSADGLVAGTYVHGVFAADGFRRAWLAALGVRGTDISYGAAVDRVLNDLADHLEEHVDVPRLVSIAADG